MTRIALVVLDTLRKDTFKEYFDWLPGRYYTDAVSTSHWTIAAHASMVTGQYPGELGVNMKNTELGGFDGPVLAERLQRSGFRTRALTANHYLAYSDGWDRGFDEFYTPWHLQNKRAFETADLMSDVTNGAEPSGLADTLRLIYASEESTWRSLRLLIRMSLPGVTHEMPDDGAQNVLNWVESNASSLREDEFLYVNLMEAHTPLDPPAEYNSAGELVSVPKRGCFAENVSEPDRIRTAYADAVRYLSNVYEAVFDRLTESYDYVITCADHGQMLGDRMLMDEFEIWGHSYGLYPELVRVPLVISGPGLGGQDTRPVSLLDIPATVAELAGVESSDWGHGIPLVTGHGGDVEPSDAAFEDRPRLTQYHGFDSFHRKKYLRNGVPESVVDSVEPTREGVATDAGYAYETHDRGLLVDGSVSEPHETLESLSDSVTDRTKDTVHQEFPDRVLDQLEDLGYV